MDCDGAGRDKVLRSGNQQRRVSHEENSISGRRDRCDISVSLSLGRHGPCGAGQVTLKVPNGFAFSEFRGYENWQNVAVSQTENGLKVIAANRAMIKAYRNGIARQRQAVPEGSKIVKIEWTTKKSAESPYLVMVPDTLKSVSFIEKDSKRFADTGGWGYAQFQNDAASARLQPFGNDAACGLRVPYGGGGKRLHFHGISKAVNDWSTNPYCGRSQA